MKLLGLLFSIAVGVISASDAPGDPLLGRSTDTCGDPANALPFFRMYYSPDIRYLYTANLNTVDAGMSSGYTFQGRVDSPLYHLFSAAATDFLYTMNTTEVASAMGEGYATIANDPQTYIYPTQICGSVSFYTLYNAAKRSHFYTASETERLEFLADQGYADMGIVGYILPASAAQSAC
ncbi:hypothetical protein K438DRAFT_1827157 [Mycena galopus ATCC 62051]|nr:hypothetical protein K438DRAFT_1827157 [Mycena galopus ATCC 62051]